MGDPDSVKWAIIALASLAIVLLTHHFLIRQNNVLRFLFGMRPLARKPSLAALPAT